MILLKGKETAEAVKKEIAVKVAEMVSRGERPPHLAAVLVGNDGASKTYVANKEKACAAVGFKSTLLTFPDTVTEEELLGQIEKLNNDDSVDGFIVQLPLPGHIDERRIIERIAPEKDVDGFSPVNVGHLCLGDECYVPCTPKGIIEILRYYGIKTEGKKVVVIGRSNIVGKPMAMLLMQKGADATVTVCNTKTPDLCEFTKDADIIIVATGRPGTLDASMCRDDAVIIDVGVNRISDPSREKGYRLVGDVDYKSFENTSCMVTPVPGGVGLMTVMMLMENTYLAAERRAK